MDISEIRDRWKYSNMINELDILDFAQLDINYLLAEIDRLKNIMDSAGEWIANAEIAVEPGWEGSRDYILRKLEDRD